MVESKELQTKSEKSKIFILGYFHLVPGILNQFTLIGIILDL